MGAPNGTHRLPQVWRDNPAPSVLDLIKHAASFHAAIINLPVDLVGLSERALADKIRARDPNGHFDRTLGAIKIKFWQEYFVAYQTKEVIPIDSIYDGVCNNAWFHRNLIQDPLNLAFLICPPTDEIILQREMLARGMSKLRDAMELPLTETYIKTVTVRGEKVNKEYTRINVSFLREVHAIVRTLQDRVNGAVVMRQQIESKSVNVNVGAPPTNRPPSIDDPNITMAQLEAFEAKIKQVQSTMEKLLPATLEAEEVETEAE